MIDIILNNLIPFIIILTILVFVHELGHYLIARKNGVKVEVFSIGFGPVLMSMHDKRGTKWQIAAFPLGGYVKFLGDKKVATVIFQHGIPSVADNSVVYPRRVYSMGS